MEPVGVLLSSYDYMKVPANAQAVYAQVSSGSMPPDAPWSAAWVDLFKTWMDGGYQP